MCFLVKEVGYVLTTVFHRLQKNIHAILGMKLDIWFRNTLQLLHKMLNIP